MSGRSFFSPFFPGLPNQAEDLTSPSRQRYSESPLFFLPILSFLIVKEEKDFTSFFSFPASLN